LTKNICVIEKFLPFVRNSLLCPCTFYAYMICNIQSGCMQFRLIKVFLELWHLINAIMSEGNIDYYSVVAIDL
jgi:hypothetical protein